MATRITVRGLPRGAGFGRRTLGQLKKTGERVLKVWRLNANLQVHRDLGTYEKGWQKVEHEAGGVGVILTSRQTNTAPHALTLEDGRKPGAKPPPVGPIFRWAERKGILANDKTEGAKRHHARNIALKIGRDGLPASHPAENGLGVSTSAIEKIVGDFGEFTLKAL